MCNHNTLSLVIIILLTLTLPATAYSLDVNTTINRTSMSIWTNQSKQKTEIKTNSVNDTKHTKYIKKKKKNNENKKIPQQLLKIDY